MSVLSVLTVDCFCIQHLEKPEVQDRKPLYVKKFWLSTICVLSKSFAVYYKLVKKQKQKESGG